MSFSAVSTSIFLTAKGLPCYFYKPVFYNFNLLILFLAEQLVAGRAKIMRESTFKLGNPDMFNIILYGLRKPFLNHRSRCFFLFGKFWTLVHIHHNIWISFSRVLQISKGNDKTFWFPLNNFYSPQKCLSMAQAVSSFPLLAALDLANNAWNKLSLFPHLACDKSW